MIRVGLIGAGKMGISHLSILGAHRDVQVVGVADTSKMVVDVFKKYSKFETFSDYKKMIDSMDLEALVIASPTKYHGEMVSYALQNNIHLFCEKPFSLDYEDGKKLALQADRLELVNQVGYHNRFIGTFNEVKRLLSANLIGELYHFSGESYGPVVLKEKGGTWRSERNAGGGCLYDYASHTIDLINFILGIVGIRFFKGNATSQLICIQETNEWVQETTAANVFVTVHIICIIVQCGISVLVFYQTPLKAGLLVRKVA